MDKREKRWEYTRAGLIANYGNLLLPDWFKDLEFQWPNNKDIFNKF